MCCVKQEVTCKLLRVGHAGFLLLTASWLVDEVFVFLVIDNTLSLTWIQLQEIWIIHRYCTQQNQVLCFIYTVGRTRTVTWNQEYFLIKKQQRSKQSLLTPSFVNTCTYFKCVQFVASMILKLLANSIQYCFLCECIILNCS